MSKKEESIEDKSIDLSKIKIVSVLSLIGILVGFGITIGINMNSFENMKEQLTSLSNTMNSLESKIYDKLDKQTTEFNKEIKQIQKSNTEMQVKMEYYIQSLK